MSKYICEHCCGDALSHPYEEAWEIVMDEPCDDCGGTGVTEEAGDPINITKYLKGKRNYYDADVDFYVGEGVDDYEEFPIKFHAVYYGASYGAREHGTGMQLEPDEPAGFEIDDFHVEINGQWYYFEPTDDQEEQAIKAITEDQY